MKLSMALNSTLIQPYNNVPSDAMILFLDDGRIYSSHNGKIIDYQGKVDDPEPDSTETYNFNLAQGSTEELIRAKFFGNEYNFSKLLTALKDSGAFLITDFSNMLDIEKKDAKALIGFLMINSIIHRKFSWLLLSEKWESKIQTIYNNYQGEGVREEHLTRSFEEVRKSTLREKKEKPSTEKPEPSLKQSPKQKLKHKGSQGVRDTEDLTEEELAEIQGSSNSDDLRNMIGKEVKVDLPESFSADLPEKTVNKLFPPKKTSTPKTPRKFKPKKK